MRTPSWLGLLLSGSLGIGCSSKPAKPTREECTRAAEHIADLILAYYRAQPMEWFDAMGQEPGDSGVPTEITRDSFKAWLETDAGKTFLVQRKGNTLAGVQRGIEPCVENATKAQVKCLLDATSKDDVLACDAKHARPGAAPIAPSRTPPSGGAGPAMDSAGSASGSAAPGSGSAM